MQQHLSCSFCRDSGNFHYFVVVCSCVNCHTTGLFFSACLFVAFLVAIYCQKKLPQQNFPFFSLVKFNSILLDHSFSARRICMCANLAQMCFQYLEILYDEVLTDAQKLMNNFTENQHTICRLPRAFLVFLFWPNEENCHNIAGIETHWQAYQA